MEVRQPQPHAHHHLSRRGGGKLRLQRRRSGYEPQVGQAGQGRDDSGAGGLRQGRAHHIHAHGQRHGKHVRLRPPTRTVAGMLLTANGDSIMQTQYKYDPVDNILGLTNVIIPKAPTIPPPLADWARTLHLRRQRQPHARGGRQSEHGAAHGVGRGEPAS